MHRLLAAALVSILVCGCATAFRPGKPVDVQEGPIGNVYKQEGEQVGLPQLLTGLEAVDASHAEARVARGWAIGAATTGAVGGLALGYGIVAAADGKSNGWALIGAGVAVSAVGIWVGVIGDRHTAAAVKAYNGQLPEQPKVTVVPYLAPAPAVGQRAPSGFEGGLVMRF